MTTQQLREMNRLSQHEFADKLGISQNAVSKWEMKDTKIRKDIVDKIYKIFGYGKKDNGRVTSFNIGEQIR